MRLHDERRESRFICDISWRLSWPMLKPLFRLGILEDAFECHEKLNICVAVEFICIYKIVDIAKTTQ